MRLRLAPTAGGVLVALPASPGAVWCWSRVGPGRQRPTLVVEQPRGPWLYLPVGSERSVLRVEGRAGEVGWWILPALGNVHGPPRPMAGLIAGVLRRTLGSGAHGARLGRLAERMALDPAVVELARGLLADQLEVPAADLARAWVAVNSTAGPGGLAQTVQRLGRGAGDAVPCLDRWLAELMAGVGGERPLRLLCAPEPGEVLGLPPDWRQRHDGELRRAWRSAARRLHPDADPRPGAGQRFQVAARAWAQVKGELVALEALEQLAAAPDEHVLAKMGFPAAAWASASRVRVREAACDTIDRSTASCSEVPRHAPYAAAHPRCR